MIDIVDPAEPYSAGRFLEDAMAGVRDISARGRLPLLVGGTMLYFRVLREGLAKLPGADASVRRWLDSEAGRVGWPAMHRRLAAVDPEAAAKIAPNDSQRIQRALEVHQLTGETISSRRAQHPAPSLRTVTIALWPEQRSRLVERVDERFDAMIEEGLLDEVDSLFRRGDLSANTPAMRCVGYRQLWSYLSGDVDFDDACRAARVATRRLAKRQFTWLRREPVHLRLDPFAGDPAAPALRLAERVARGDDVSSTPVLKSPAAAD